MEAQYEPLPSMPEDGGGPDPHLALLGSEQWQWAGVANLDQFFTRIYRYWQEQGFLVMLTSRVLNLLALAFTVAMSALLLLYVNWGALRDECLKRDTCDIWEVAVRRHPLAGGLTVWTGLSVLYLTLFSAYWLAALAHLVVEVRELAEVRHFCAAQLGLSERQLATMTWPEVAHRLVQVQRTHRLCLARDLSEHDIVARVMRRENYLVGMVNKGVLALNVPIPGLRRHFLLTKTLEWNLYWCILDAMFDDHFRLKPAFLRNEAALRRRLRVLAACNLAAAPFLLVFLVIYFFMKNAEQFYHHPSSVGARRWSPLAQWRLREFNELPHFIKHRLDASHRAAEAYIAQFPNPVVSHVARFVAFVAGSVAALLLFVTLIDERLLERDLFGRQLVWWVAVVGVVLALSRAFVIEAGTAFDPEAALMEVVAHTHYLPRHWRGRAHTLEVQQEFQALFQFKALLFLEELASILLTPLLLWFSLPQCAGAVLDFVEHNTVTVEGVGDVCSLSAFDVQRHGNARYGSPYEAPKAHRSRQGKLEKSLVSFAATYPAWEPDAAGQQMLQQLAKAPAAAAASASLAWSMLPGQPQPQLRRLQPGATQQQRLAAVLERKGGAANAADSGGIFASADLTGQEPPGFGGGLQQAGGAAAVAVDAGGPPPANLAASLALQLAPGGGASLAGEAPLDAVATSQLLLQSLYEERRQQHYAPSPQQREQQQREQQAGAVRNGLQAVQQAEEQQRARPHPLAHSGLGSEPSNGPSSGAAARGNGQADPQPPVRAVGFSAQPASQGRQGPAMPIPQQRQWQGAGAAAPGRPAAAAAASPLHQLLASPSPEQRMLQQAGLPPAASPRQPWLGRSPSGRARLAEMSVLSRENSCASAAPPPPAAEGGDAAPPVGPPLGGPLLGLLPHELPSAETSVSEEASESLLLQHQLAMQGSGGQHGGSHGDGSSEGPPEFF